MKNNKAINYRIKNTLQSFIGSEYGIEYRYKFNICRYLEFTVLQITVYTNNFPASYKCIFIDNYTYEIDL